MGGGRTETPAPTPGPSLHGMPYTLMAWPKQPLPNTSPWMRSDGRKMRCGRQTTRRDSERPRSLRWEAGEPSELAPGDLSMLQLLLGGTHTSPVSLGACGHLAEAPWGQPGLSLPLPFACHAPLYVSVCTVVWPKGVAQGSSLLGRSQAFASS